MAGSHSSHDSSESRKSGGSDCGRELIQRYLEGRLSEADLAELEALLVANAGLADEFAEAARLHASLEIHFRQQYQMAQMAAVLEAVEPLSEQAAPSSTFVPQFGGSRSAVSIEVAEVPATAPVRQIQRWKWVAAVVLLLAVGMSFWAARGPSAARYRLVSGRVVVEGREVAEIPGDVGFEVVGPGGAVVGLPGGARVELAAGTVASLRCDPGQLVLQLVSGGGDFVVPGGSSELRVETVLGVVASTGGRFQLDLVTSPAADLFPSAALRVPRLTVAVTQGTVTVEQAGIMALLAAGERRVFVARA